MSRCFVCHQETGTLFVDAEGVIRCCTCHAMSHTYGIIATTPSDDGEPITREWMTQEYGSCDLDVPSELGVAVDQDNAVFLEIATAWRYAQTRLPHIRTRGQLRQLLALLGYQKKDSVQ